MFNFTVTEDYNGVLELCVRAFENRKEVYVSYDSIYLVTLSGATVAMLDNAVVISCGENFLNKSMKSSEISKLKKEILDRIDQKTVEIAKKLKEIESSRIQQIKDFL